MNIVKIRLHNKMKDNFLTDSLILYQSCEYHFGVCSGLTIGMKYFGTDQYRCSVSSLLLIYIYIYIYIERERERDLLIYIFILFFLLIIYIFIEPILILIIIIIIEEIVFE